MLKKGIFLIAIGYTIFIFVASLSKLDNLPSVNVSFADKIFHFGAYGLLTVLWFFSFLFKFEFKFKKALFLAVTLSIIFGIVLEILQDRMTSYRALDVYDALANTLGVLLASLTLWATKKIYIKNI